MSLSTLTPVTCRVPSVTGVNGSHPNASKVTLVNRRPLPALKMKEKEQPLLQETSTVSSRREMMHLTAASLCFASLFFSAPAEASPRNATMRQKIMEKLEELKRKTGISKPSDEGDGSKANDNEAKKSKPNSETYGSKVKSKDDVARGNPKDATNSGSGA